MRYRSVLAVFVGNLAYLVIERDILIDSDDSGVSTCAA